ncbi:MAG: hypothetical protein JWM67_120 [Mycobacterium sp.]|nr:hypothetical protein [Mycobacterium sp.]
MPVPPRAVRPRPRRGAAVSAAPGARAGGERGTASVELVLVIPLLFAVLAVALALGSAFVTQLRLERAAAEAAGFATAMPGTARPGLDFTRSSFTQRPNCQEVVDDARSRLASAGVAAKSAVTVTVYFDAGDGTLASAACSAPPGPPGPGHDAVDGTAVAGRTGLQDWGAGSSGVCDAGKAHCAGTKQISLAVDHGLGIFQWLAAGAGLPLPSTMHLTGAASDRQQ